MSNIKESALELIGGTPILKLNGYAKKERIASMKYMMGSLSMINVQLVTGIKRKYLQAKSNLV